MLEQNAPEWGWIIPARIKADSFCNYPGYSLASLLSMFTGERTLKSLTPDIHKSNERAKI